MSTPLNLGIIISSTREGRVGPSVAEWVKSELAKRTDATLTIIDLKNYQLPLLGEGTPSHLEAFKADISAQDGFIFVTAEYNHSIPASLKNAIDYLREEWHNKAAGIVSYGSAGGARAAEHLRAILGEIKIADVRSHVLLSLFHDFEKFSTFKPQEGIHDNNLNALTQEVTDWATALKTLR